MEERDIVETPVPVVQPGRMTIMSGSGVVAVPIAVTRDWALPQPDVTRAIIVIHGWPRRDLRSGERAMKAAAGAGKGSMIVTPQFLTAKDIVAHGLPAGTLRWKASGWQKGGPSDDATAISSFAVVDEIFRRLADREIFPHLRIVVLAGHSAGGQFVQRYAAIGHGESQFKYVPVHVRYVVANPSSYLYFTDARPNGHGGMTSYSAPACSTFNRWPYGLESGSLPAYAASYSSPAAIKDSYVKHDVVYLLGEADNDPMADGLDRSCSAEREGPTRLSRGLAYNDYVHLLDATTTQHVLTVPRVGHHSVPMYTSPCGLHALFDTTGCH